MLCSRGPADPVAPRGDAVRRAVFLIAGLPPIDTARKFCRAEAKSVARVLPCTRRSNGLLGATPAVDTVRVEDKMNGSVCLGKEFTLYR